jgi:hypothetical protein
LGAPLEGTARVQHCHEERPIDVLALDAIDMHHRLEHEVEAARFAQELVE